MHQEYKRTNMVAMRVSLLAFLFFLVNPAACISQQINRPDVNWDRSAYHATRLGHSGWFHGSATYYASYGSSGACGFPLSFVNSIYHAATPDPRWSKSNTAGVGGFSGAACGQCYELRCIEQPRYNHQVFCNPGTMKVRVADCDTPKSPAWPSNHFDLSPEGFGRLADIGAGIVNIKFRRVHCRSRYTKWTLASDSNGFFHDIVVYDVPATGSVTAIWAKPAGQKWIKLSHAWGAHYWAFGNYYVGGNTEVKAVLSENRGQVKAHFVPGQA